MQKQLVAVMTCAVAVLIAGCAEPRIPTAPSTSSLRGLEVANASSAAEAGRYLIVASSHNLPDGLADRVAALGGSLAESFDGIGVAVATGLNADAASQLGKSQGIGHVELDEEIQWIENTDDVEVEEASATDAPSSHGSPTTAGFYPRQWGMRAIGADKAWAIGRLGSPSVTVSILDSGIDYTHSALVGLVDLARSRSFVPSDVALAATRFPGQDLHPIVDMNRHGTHVASTVASTGHVTAGVTQKVTLVGVKVLAASGSGATSGVLAGIMYAADIDSDVINMSLGSTFSKKEFPGRVAGIQRAVNYATRKGTLVVASAGNESDDLDKLGDGFKSYCDAATVICVSATAPAVAAPTNVGPWTDVDSFASSYSNFGSAVDVAAPGGTGGNRFIWAACSSYSGISTACQASKNFGLGISGTSMATPHVTGMAALIVEDVGRNQPGLVKELVRRYVDDVGTAGEDAFFGRGRISVAKAVGAQ